MALSRSASVRSRAAKRSRSAASEATQATLALRRMPPAGFPESKKVRLRYATSLTLDPPDTGTLSYTSICANGMFDPELALGGHQPMGFDQWMAVYNHYTVSEAVIQMRWVPISATSVTPGVFGVLLDDDSSMPYAGNYLAMVESGRAKHSTYGLTEGIGSGRSPRVIKYFNAKKFFGSKYIQGDLKYAGNSAKNPDENVYFHVWAASGGSGADPPSQRFEIIVDYVATLTEPRALPVS